MSEQVRKQVSDQPISGKQMKRLQTLWGLFARQARIDAKDRAARLGWVAGAIGRQIESFKGLTKAEANTAISAIQKHLPPEQLRSRRPGRRLAQAYGTAGRRKGSQVPERGSLGDKTIPLPDARTFALIESLTVQLGWTRERLDAFLRSPKSPLRGGAVRTLADANRVIWALKGMLRRAGVSTLKRDAPASMKEESRSARAGTPPISPEVPA